MGAERGRARGPMLAVSGGGAPHAPEFTRHGLLASYVAGADVLRLPLRLSKDERVVVAPDETVRRLTGKDGAVAELTLRDLRDLDIGKTYTEADGSAFSYRAQVEPLGLLLDLLPPEVWLLLELPAESSADRMTAKVRRVSELLRNRGRQGRAIAAAADAAPLQEFLKLTPGATTLVQGGGSGPGPAEAIERAQKAGLQGVMLDAPDLIDGDGKPTAVARLVADAKSSLSFGAVARVETFSADALAALAALPQIPVVTIPSIIEWAAAVRPGWLWIDEPWDRKAASGEDVNRDLWHLGYAKYNPEGYCHVYPDGGVHVDIAPFTGPVTYHSTGNSVADQLQELRERTWNANKDWPFYSGGGVGFVPGIEGDFSAEVDVESRTASQATTVEMAALNVDPPAHREPWRRDPMKNLIPNPPASARDKHTFFDPHGAPPYVGVEHDEDDGWRINWNLGTDYDSNQYGRAVGDGRLLTGRMRLDRRGPYFAVYVRQTGKGEPRDWVCVGTVRNDSLNSRVFLRLAGKRWRQEDPAAPSTWMPVIPNHFVFRNFRLRRFP